MAEMKNKPGLMGEVPQQAMPPEAPQEAPEEETEAVSPDEQEAFETMVAGLRDHIFGGGEQGIRDKLRQSEDVHGDVGNMALALVMEGAKQAEASGVDADFEMLMSVGSEIIEDLLEIADAMGVLDGVDDDDRMKAMFSAIRGYLASADVPEEEREAAKQQLQMMQADGSVDEVAGEIQRLGEKEGIDPFADGEQVPSAQPTRMMQG